MTFRRLTHTALTAAATLCATATAAQATPVAATQTTAALVINEQVYRAAGHSKTAMLADTRPITGDQTVVPVIASKQIGKQTWLEVRLPQRPDGATGWISANGVQLTTDPWHIVVNRAQRHAYIYDHGKLVKSWPVVVGKPSTPTPAGQFFVAEVVYEGYGIATGPYALATSAYSNVYQEFEGGPGQVALHGVLGLTGVPGQAASHGCVRFYDQDITWLAKRVPAGTPITIL